MVDAIITNETHVAVDNQPEDDQPIKPIHLMPFLAENARDIDKENPQRSDNAENTENADKIEKALNSENNENPMAKPKIGGAHFTNGDGKVNLTNGDNISEENFKSGAMQEVAPPVLKGWSPLNQPDTNSVKAEKLENIYSAENTKSDRIGSSADTLQHMR